MNIREQQKMETRKEILETSEKLFHEKGFEKTSIQMIAHACGISKGALYHHFKSKEEVLERICQNQYRTLLDAFLPLAEIRDGRMTEKIRGIMSVVRQGDMNLAALTFPGDAPEGSVSTENAGMEKMLDFYSEKVYLKIFTPILKEGRERGECGFTGSPEMMALFIHQLDSGMTLQIRRILSGEPDEAEFRLTEAVDSFTSALSRLLDIPLQTVEEMILSREMLQNYKSLLAKTGK